jgi:HxlR-like helix-turn-helix protein
MLERVRYCTDPAWYEYRLTERALDLYPVIVGLMRWADRHLVPENDDVVAVQPPLVRQARRTLPGLLALQRAAHGARHHPEPDASRGRMTPQPADESAAATSLNASGCGRVPAIAPPLPA